MDQNGVSSIMAMLVYRSVSRNSQCFEDVFNASFFGGAGGQISFTSCNTSRIFHLRNMTPQPFTIIHHPNVQLFQVQWPQGSFDLCQINTKLGQLFDILGFSQCPKQQKINSSKTHPSPNAAMVLLER